MNSEIATKPPRATCFANRHMRPVEYALWDLARKLAHKTGVLYFDGRDIARMFEGTGKDSIYRAAKSLTRKGWLELIVPTKRDGRTGLFLPAQYRVLSAEEWSDKHPHSCEASSPQNATGETGQTIQSQVSDRCEPVASTRMTSPRNATYSDKENYDKRDDSSVTRTDERVSPFRRTQLSAAHEAYKEFQADENLNMFEMSDAFGMLQWCLYRAASSTKEVPATVSFYRKVRDNFLADHLGLGFVSILEEAADRFDRYARDFIADRNPELLAWVLEERRNLEAEPVPVGNDDDIWP